MTAASGPVEPHGNATRTGRQNDIAAALVQRLPPCEVTVSEHDVGQYTVTLPSWAARNLGIGTSSLIPEWRLGVDLGMQAEINGPVRRALRADGVREATFTVTLSPRRR